MCRSTSKCLNLGSCLDIIEENCNTDECRKKNLIVFFFHKTSLTNFESIPGICVLKNGKHVHNLKFEL